MPTSDAVLFPEPLRPRLRHLELDEPAVRWYVESTVPEAVSGRRVLNAWYRSFHDPRGRLATKVRSESFVDHVQALDELFVHHLLRQRSADVRYEEGEGAADFRVYAGAEGLIANVEVLSLFEQDVWDEAQQQHDKLAAEVNRRLRPTRGWLVLFEEEQLDRSPSVRHLVSFIEAEIDKLPPPGPAARAMIGDGVGYPALPSAVFRQSGVEVRMRFMYMAPDAPAMTDPHARIVATGPVIGGMVTAGERLRRRIGKKVGKRYATKGAPLLIAAGIHDMTCREVQIANGLYGQEPDLDDTDATSLRLPRSVFAAGNQSTRISGVATIERLRPWAEEVAQVTLWDHPQPALPWDITLLPHDDRLTFNSAGRGVWNSSLG